MKITITSKKYDAKTGVHVTRERGFAVAEFGKCLRHILLDEENEYGGAIDDARKALRVPGKRVKEAIADCILKALVDIELDGEFAVEIIQDKREGGHDIDA